MACVDRHHSVISRMQRETSKAQRLALAYIEGKFHIAALLSVRMVTSFDESGEGSHGLVSEGCASMVGCMCPCIMCTHSVCMEVGHAAIKSYVSLEVCQRLQL